MPRNPFRVLYLASQSPRRRLLIRRLRRPFVVVPSRCRETIRKSNPPRVNAMRNALGKARRAKLPTDAKPGIIIGSDTFLYFEGRVIGKPTSMADARRMLQALRGKSHWVYTGLCLIDTATGRVRTSCDRARVTFNTVDDAFIADMFARVNPLDKAGAYAVQEDSGRLIRAIRGDKTTVIGLPLRLLRRELKRMSSAQAIVSRA